MEAGPRSESLQDQREPDEGKLGPTTEPAELGPHDDLPGGLGAPLDAEGTGADPSLRTDGLDPDLPSADPPAETDFRELRPASRLRVWQLLPIVAFGTLGSLMFAFPLAFEFGDGGPVVAMLGLLLCCCAAGWGLMAARRVGYTWPGLPARGSGERPDWRFIAAYTCLVVLLALLAVWRVAHLR